MAYTLEAGIQISLDGVNWTKLTDHNRGPISISTTPIEKSARMANGRMRKYVVDTKDTISVEWEMVPSKSQETVDGYASSAWLNAFYDANVFKPIYVKVVESKVSTPTVGQLPNESSTYQSALSSGGKIYEAFITQFNFDIKKRVPRADYVNMKIEFTEI